MAKPPHVPQPGTELEEFFDLSIDPLSIIGFDGRFKRVNASFVSLLGYTKPELLSRTALDNLHPDDVGAGARGAGAPRGGARSGWVRGPRHLRRRLRAVARVEHAVDARAGRPVRRRTGHNRAPPHRGRVARGAAPARGQSRQAARARGGAGGAAAGGDARCSGRPADGAVRRGRARDRHAVRRRFLGNDPLRGRRVRRDRGDLGRSRRAPARSRSLGHGAGRSGDDDRGGARGRARGRLERAFQDRSRRSSATSSG